MWQLGEVDRARQLIEQSNRRASELGHPPSMAHPLLWKSHLEILRGDPAAALIAAEALQGLGQEHGLPFWRTFAELSVGWARGRLHDAATGAEDLSRALADRIEQGGLNDAWFYKGLLAELEAETLGLESALARIDEAMALARQVETRCNLPFLHLLRGKLLLERDPSNPAPAEEAFHTALAIAQEQGARSWGLRAALSLAKLYQSTARPAEARAVLAPALEGFALTPEMPEIADAQALLAALAQTEEGKAQGQHQRRLRLQTAYGEALMYSKGYAAEETKAAFARAADLAADSNESAERFSASYGQCLGRLLRSEYQEAEDIARRLLHEAEAAKRRRQTARASNVVGQACLYQGKLSAAQSAFERALAEWRLAMDSAQPLQPWIDPVVMAESNLAHVAWLAGDPAHAHQLSEQAVQRANELGHAQTSAQALLLRSLLETLRDNPAAAHRSAELLLGLARERGMELYAIFSRVYSAWARSRLSSSKTGILELRQAIADYVKSGNKIAMPFFLGLLAQRQADAEDVGAAISTIDEALARSRETRECLADAFLHRIRGDILLQRDSPDPRVAEEVYQTAIAIAKRQGARSYELLASLALAKLYQSADRAADAHAVLAPALEGFSPTPEMPEIAEAQALVESLARGSEGAIASKGQATEG
jgi:predicted ATPase